jgi:hypothetical protein
MCRGRKLMTFFGVKESISREKSQYLVLLGMSLAVLALTTTLYLADEHVFQRYFGRIDPLIAFLVIVVTGAILLSVLLSRGWFVIYQRANRNGLYLATGLATLLGTVIIIVDSIIRFPADLNVSFPSSLLFYPVIGYLVELLFHIVPLVVLLIALSLIAKDASRERLVWISIVVVALLEPIYQTVYVTYPARFPEWAEAYIVVHIFLINLAQLYIFKSYDFVSMYVFRLVYYLFWHIGWGYVRLQVLF